MFVGYTLAVLSILGTAKVAVALLVLGRADHRHVLDHRPAARHRPLAVHARPRPRPSPAARPGPEPHPDGPAHLRDHGGLAALTFVLSGPASSTRSSASWSRRGSSCSCSPAGPSRRTSRPRPTTTRRRPASGGRRPAARRRPAPAGDRARRPPRGPPDPRSDPSAGGLAAGLPPAGPARSGGVAGGPGATGTEVLPHRYPLRRAGASIDRDRPSAPGGVARGSMTEQLILGRCFVVALLVAYEAVETWRWRGSETVLPRVSA